MPTSDPYGDDRLAAISKSMGRSAVNAKEDVTLNSTLRTLAVPSMVDSCMGRQTVPIYQLEEEIEDVRDGDYIRLEETGDLMYSFSETSTLVFPVTTAYPSNPASGTGKYRSIFYWIPEKYALRVCASFEDYDSSANIGTGSISLGIKNQCGATNGITIGDTNSVEFTSEVAIGNGNTVSGASNEPAYAFGGTVNVTGAWGLGLGTALTVSGAKAVCIGRSNTASGQQSVCIGLTSTVSVQDGIAIGTTATASVGAGAVAIGHDTSAGSIDAVVVGPNQSATTGSDYSVAVGTLNAVTGSDKAGAFGYDNDVIVSTGDPADFSYALGWTNTITAAEKCIAAGYSNSIAATCDQSSAFGYDNTISAANGIALGWTNTASAANGTAVGYQNTASGAGAVAVGNGIICSAASSAAFGVGSHTNNVANSTNIVAASKLGIHVIAGSSQCNIGLNTTTFGTSADGVLSIANAATVPASSPAGLIQIYAKDSSDGSTNATLAIRTEQGVEAIGTFTPTHKLKVWHNEVEYWIQLDAV